MSPQSVKVVYFYSESRSDETLVRQVKSNLDVLQSLGYINLWSMRDILGSENIAETLKKSLTETKVVLYFFSAEFLNSKDYANLRNISVTGEESADSGGEPGESLENWILKRHQRGELHIVPILLDYIVGFEDLPYSSFSVLPSEKPLRKYGDRAERTDSCFEIGKTVKELVGKLKTASQPVKISQMSKMPPIPLSLLPQLCDRTEQSDEMRRIFGNKQISNAENKPLVCIIHGDTNECPEGYKARLEKKDFHQFLRLDYAVPIKIFNLEFPFSRFDIAAPRKFFERTLSEKFFDTTDLKTKEEFSNFIAQFRTVIINYEVFSENWNENVMKVFLEFWNNAPFQNITTTIIVNLFFSYEETTDYENITARNFFNRLRQVDFANYRNTDVTIITELDAVGKIEVFNWINDEDTFRDFCSKHPSGFCDDFLIKQAVNDIYADEKMPLRFVREIEISGQTGKRKVTLVRMRTLSKKLGDLLVNNRCRI